MFTASDSDPTMAASIRFDEIINQIQSSKLNFNIQLSPFTALISLKRYPQKDKSGSPLLPPPSESSLLKKSQIENQALSKKVLLLENFVESTKRDCENSALECEAAHVTIRKLEAELELARISFDNFKKIKKEASEDELRQKIKQIETLSKENIYLQNFSNDQTNQIQILEASKKKLEASVTKLNTQISKTTSKHNEEIAAVKKASEHRVKLFGEQSTQT